MSYIVLFTIEIRKNLNWYDEFSNDPARYQDAIMRWYASTEPD